MKLFSRTFTRRTGLIALFSAPVLYFGGWKANQLSADPVGTKELPPLFPEYAAQEVAPGQIRAAAAEAKLPWIQQGGTINDASFLNKTAIFGIVQVTSEADIAAALQFARENNGKVSIAAVRHSMGGQAFYKDALVLDMRRFNAISLDEQNKLITVQSGATWHDIQNVLHPKFAIKAMQSTDIFSVGGSISVNAHGMDHQVGALGKTIRSLRLMLTDGSIVQVSRSENPELFNLVVGGYGLFGVVLDVVLEITDNAIYQTSRRVLDYRQFPTLFADELASNQKLGLMYAHLSTGPQSFLREVLLYLYERVEVGDPTEVEIPPLGEVSSTRLRRFVLNFSKLGSIPMRLKWFAEKNIEPRMETCSVVSRNQAMKDGEACLVSRNQPMHDSVLYLKNDLPNETDILQEYFIPRQQLLTFIDSLRAVMLEHEVKLLNASVRVVHKEDNFLNYAPDDAFSVVLYINQTTDEQGNAKMKVVTQQIIDLTTKVGGRFFLPYQLHYTPEQLRQAYPEIDDFFAAKLRYDPGEILTNTFYERYKTRDL